MSVYSFDEIADRVRPIAEKHKLRAVWLFGSYARGDADEESDVDLLVEPSEQTNSSWCYGGLYADLEDAFEKQVDMVTLRALEEQRGTKLGGRFVQEVELDRRRIV